MKNKNCNYAKFMKQNLLDALFEMQQNLSIDPANCINKSFTNDKFISAIYCIYHNRNCFECLMHYLQEEGNSIRYINGLDSIDDISILLKYLYLSEDHKITITNTFNIIFDLKMNSDFTFTSTYVNGVCPGESRNCTSEVTVEYLREVVRYLKEQKPTDFPDVFKNRWEEIKKITMSNLALNDSNRKRMNV